MPVRVQHQLVPDRKPGTCPPGHGWVTLSRMPEDSPERADLIASLVEANVALTSTLGVHEPFSSAYTILSNAAMATLAPSALRDYLTFFASAMSRSPELSQQYDALWKRGLAMEREFVAAGGLLMAGSDSTGVGQMLPGFGNHRTMELHAAAGFTPEEAVKIATQNGAIYLGLEDRIGSIAVGMNTDLFVVAGDPSSDMADVQNVEIVFKDGRGYDSRTLLESVRGTQGRY